MKKQSSIELYVVPQNTGKRNFKQNTAISVQRAV